MLPTSFSSRDGRSSKRALRLALVVSLVAHFWVSPWRSWLGMLVTDASEVKDKPLELPMELSFEEQNTTPPPQETIDAPPAPVAEVKKPKPMHDAGAPQPVRDPGPPFDAGARLAIANDAGLPPGALGTAAPARGENEVDLIVNMAVVRAHPEGARVGALLLNLPVWNLIAGTGVNPVRDFDAIRAYGPSIWMSKAKTLGVDLRYNASDSLIDSAAIAFSRRNPSGAAWSFTSPTVRAYPAKILGSDVVMLRGKSHTLSIVKPTSQAGAVASYMETNARDVPVWADQGLWLRVKDPHGQVAQFPAGADVLEVKIETTSEGAAKVVIHVSAKTPQDARDLADAYKTYSGVYGLYAMQTPELPARALDDAKVQISGSDLDITVRVTGDELHKLIDYVVSFCERHSGCS